MAGASTQSLRDTYVLKSEELCCAPIPSLLRDMDLEISAGCVAAMVQATPEERQPCLGFQEHQNVAHKACGKQHAQLHENNTAGGLRSQATSPSVYALFCNASSACARCSQAQR